MGWGCGGGRGRWGRPEMADAWVGAIALAHGAPLVTCDRNDYRCLCQPLKLSASETRYHSKNMKRKILRCLLILGAVASFMPAQNETPPAAPSFDKAKLEAWARHLLVWGAGINVAVTDPEPSPVAGFSQV